LNRWIIPGLFLVILAASLVWRVQQVQTRAAETSQSRSQMRGRAQMVMAVPVQRRTLSREIEELVTIRAPLNVNVAPKVSGRLEFLQVHEGDRVKRGQLLIRLDPQELAAQQREMEAALAVAEARLSEARLGRTPQIAQTQAAIDQALADVSAARAELRQAEASADSQRAEARHAVAEARARLVNDEARLRRVETLLEKGFVAAQEVDNARSATGVSQATVNAALEREKLVDAQVKADLEVARESLKRAQARLELARANRAQDRMYGDHVTSLEAAVRQERAAVANAKAARLQTEVHAPIDGYVSARLMDPGAMATPGQTILTLMDIRTVWAEVSISEEHAGRIGLNDTATVTLDALPQVRLVGRVIQVNPAANPQSRAFTVRLELDNSAQRIKPGMFGRARFVVERRANALVVPHEALLGTNTPDGPHVFVVEDGKARRVGVTVRSRQGPWAEVMGRESGALHEGQPVITIGLERLEDGASVKVARTTEDATAVDRPGVDRGLEPVASPIHPAKGGSRGTP
jgi:RND family efflux transporter MFP subunit